MANGYGMLMSVVQEPGNVPFLQESLERHFWHQHMSMDTLVGAVSEYYAVNRPWVYRDVGEKWVVDDFIGSYMSRLDRFGLKPPARLGEVARFVDDMHHSAALALAAIWPLNFWRIDPIVDRDYEWFENAYPGGRHARARCGRATASSAIRPAATCSCRTCRRCRRSARCATCRASCPASMRPRPGLRLPGQAVRGLQRGV